MRQKREERKDAEYLCKTFIELRKRFHPVMRHYFTEQHKTPMAWFRTRLNYTRSVATTSIVGHLLGLGDRHISNILLDTKNGEVIHIDLGIAFEQVRSSTRFLHQQTDDRACRGRISPSRSASLSG